MKITDSFAQISASDSIAEQPPSDGILHSFEKEREVAFKEEIYIVRDNGAVFRRARAQGRRRKLDEIWTFGTVNRHSGYLQLNGHVVHRIVAMAFNGPSPSTDHVVDHVDTNRQNNRSDNLRWVTRLENILLNPITRARIEVAFGSLDAFFENPAARLIHNWDWMRTVTKDEAQESRKRLLAWAENGQAGRGGTLGEWLYKPLSQFSSPAGKDIGEQAAAFVEATQQEAFNTRSFTAGANRGNVPRRRATFANGAQEPESSDIPSLTAGAFQRNWRTPTEFPQCTAAVAGDAHLTYLARLVPGTVFARNRYGESNVVVAAIGPERTLSVVCNIDSGVKDWSHAKVFVEGDAFCHESGRTFFTQEGAMKAHCMAIGEPFEAYEGSIDDYC
jgi:hypothetical protein